MSATITLVPTATTLALYRAYTNNLVFSGISVCVIFWVTSYLSILDFFQGNDFR